MTKTICEEFTNRIINETTTDLDEQIFNKLIRGYHQQNKSYSLKKITSLDSWLVEYSWTSPGEIVSETFVQSDIMNYLLKIDEKFFDDCDGVYLFLDKFLFRYESTYQLEFSFK